jgi:hypothetical protein
MNTLKMTFLMTFLEPRHITGLDFFCAANAQNDLVHEPVVDTVPDQSNHEGDQRAVCATEGPTNPDCDHGRPGSRIATGLARRSQPV